jgi:hypothetical protein
MAARLGRAFTRGDGLAHHDRDRAVCRRRHARCRLPPRFAGRAPRPPARWRSAIRR